MSLQTETTRTGNGSYSTAQPRDLDAVSENDVQRIRDAEMGIRELSKGAIEEHKSSAEAIADQAVAFLTRANAHINEGFDALQRKLDELRRLQREHMQKAELTIRAAMNWNDYMADSMTQLDSGIEQARGDLAKLTKS